VKAPGQKIATGILTISSARMSFDADSDEVARV